MGAYAINNYIPQQSMLKKKPSNEIVLEGGAYLKGLRLNVIMRTEPL